MYLQMQQYQENKANGPFISQVESHFKQSRVNIALVFYITRWILQSSKRSAFKA